jgi:hypothetical protein
VGGAAVEQESVGLLTKVSQTFSVIGSYYQNGAACNARANQFGPQLPDLIIHESEFAIVNPSRVASPPS